MQDECSGDDAWRAIRWDDQGTPILACLEEAVAPIGTYSVVSIRD